MTTHTTLFFFRTGTLVAASLVTLLSGVATAADSTARLAREMKLKQRQVETYEQQFTKTYGADVWYVFQVTILVPDVSQSVTRVASEFSYRDFAAVNVTTRLVTKTYKLYGSRPAADMLWDAIRSSVCYEYRAFRTESEADAFRQSIQR